MQANKASGERAYICKCCEQPFARAGHAKEHPVDGKCPGLDTGPIISEGAWREWGPQEVLAAFIMNVRGREAEWRAVNTHLTAEQAADLFSAVPSRVARVIFHADRPVHCGGNNLRAALSAEYRGCITLQGQVKGPDPKPAVYCTYARAIGLAREMMEDPRCACAAARLPPALCVVSAPPVATAHLPPVLSVSVCASQTCALLCRRYPTLGAADDAFPPEMAHGSHAIGGYLFSSADLRTVNMELPVVNVDVRRGCQARFLFAAVSGV